ncbi:YpmS family protein [Bacillus sp. T33-2]|uniref:YpmS family protein n=1 Tax=Bacillus sp. T33-2 TaxID=2054168 RepID=UPI000C79520C|nr:YpmS family protein [Bacillus sp. T33-2]PLR98886.1 DUF2140 domain-containing protein [Bacillus sp. T33-2]
MKNKWKLAFFILAGILVAGAAVLFIMAASPAEDAPINKVDRNEDANDVKFLINTNKSDLNKIINHYLDEQATGSVDYEVVLRDEVELYGTIPVFSQDLQMKLTFEPEALKNGDLILKQKTISIGKLQLPVSYVLNFIRNSYNLPEWVNIQPNDEMVYVSMRDLKLKSDIKVRVNEFDLKEDNISFTLLVPTK